MTANALKSADLAVSELPPVIRGSVQTSKVTR